MAEDEAQGDKTADMQAKDAEMMERLQEEIRNLPVREHVVYMMHSLSSLAVARMGLEDESGARRDLEQARVAIDAFRALLEIIERGQPAGAMASHRGMLSQLQLAYVGALEAGTSQPAQQAGAEPDPAERP
ncbi:MAG: hypothetical protein A2133_00995 [Actinobacteria bacterium RBG_16_64_13]|nr:MAG: hypothetical protein A2133_00995 [Actinobacteria bacterium RBG_16_64_13]